MYVPEIDDSDQLSPERKRIAKAVMIVLHRHYPTPYPMMKVFAECEAAGIRRMTEEAFDAWARDYMSVSRLAADP